MVIMQSLATIGSDNLNEMYAIRWLIVGDI
jgi:hypothetical protein